MQFLVGDVVWVRTHPLSRADEGYMAKLAAKWKGPAKVVKVLGPVNCSVRYIDSPDQWRKKWVCAICGAYGGRQSDG